MGISKNSIEEGSKILTTTWAMKKKSNGKYQEKFNTRGYRQVDGIHYQEDNKVAPVVSCTTKKIVMAMMVSMKSTAHVMDILGEFLSGNFTDGEELFMEIPQLFESKFDKGTVLKLNRKIYGLKHAANACWNEFLASMLAMEYKINEAIPCLYYKWK
jgi:hypothetical protein